MIEFSTIQEFRRKTNARGSEGYFARLALDKIARGEVTCQSLPILSKPGFLKIILLLYS
jgi:hypothetical protein